MAILFEYMCAGCSAQSEHMLEAPAPEQLMCPWCGQTARRTWRTAGLVGGVAPKVEPRSAINASCAANPDIPALCHLSPDARRRLVAKARGDNRSLEAEIKRQEDHLAQRGTPLASVVSHDHSHGTSHHHDHATTPAKTASDKGHVH